MAIPAKYPVLGKDAFRTATGVHAAAVIKAKQKGDEWLANRVYSGVPAELFGCEQVIEIGPMSGESNVVYWLDPRGIEAPPDLGPAVIGRAKQGNQLPGESEINSAVGGGRPPRGMVRGGSAIRRLRASSFSSRGRLVVTSPRTTTLSSGTWRNGSKSPERSSSYSSK